MKLSASRALLVAGVVLCAVLVLKGSSLLVPSGHWTPEGTMATARLGASAALLADGRILITGGDPGAGAVTTADFFNTDGTISSAPAMSNARSHHISVTLKDGRVLVAGGITAGGSTTSTVEIFDPTTNSWTVMGVGMVEARSGATASLLSDGRVLIAGGQNGSTISSTIEVFDPALGAFTSAGMMSSPRTQHAVAALQDGRVLIVGGFNGSVPVASTDIFDPVAGMVSAGPNLSVARFGHSSTTLLNGQVVVIGGNNGNANPAQMDATSAEMVDFTAATPAFTTIATNLATPREGHLAILLPNNNNILIAGGTSAGATIASAELFIPQETPQGVWTYGFGATGALTTARSRVAGSVNQLNAPSSTMQRNGVVMVAGGNDASGNALNTTEAYGYPTVQTDQSDYAPGTTVTITGSGFQPNEVVTIQLVESPQIDTHGPYTVQADANGTFADGSFSTDLHDINLQFYLSAIGGTSGFQAQNTFTDSKPNTVTLSPTSVTVAPGSSAQYTVTVNFNGNLNNPCTSPLSIQTPPSLPTGAAASFSPTSVTGSNSNPNPTSTLTITTTNVTPPGSTTFNVLAGSGAGCQAGTVTGTGTLVVVENTATTLISSVNPTVFGQSTTLTATVTQVTGPTTPNAGTVTFKDGANTLGTGTLNASGVATLAVSTLIAGSHSLTASYAGAANTFGASTSNTITQTVNQASTTTALTSSANASVFGQSVTFTATVTVNSPGAGTIPAGETVTFKDGATTLGTGTTNASGVATFATSTLTIATHSITAVYAGDANFATSTSTAISQVVNKANTTTALASSANPSMFGQSVTFTATVTVSSPGAGTIPTGETVTFKDGITTLGTGTTNASGVATLATSTLMVATHSVTAVYAGDPNFATSTSGAVSQVVDPANTTTTVTSSANPSVFGLSVTFTATVTVNSPGAGTIPASDTVSFKDGATTIGTGTTNASGVATLATSSFTVATHSVTAVYAGDANFATSTSTAISQVVNKASTTTTITNDLSTATGVGQAYSVTVSVTINAPGAGTIPNGDTITVSDGSAMCTVTLSSAGGSCSLTSTAAGNKTVTATYNGDANLNASTSAGVVHTVNKGNTTTTITSNTPNPSTVGQSVTINYAVSVNSPAAGTLTGNVTVSDGLGNSCTAAVAAGTCSVTFNTAGTKTLTATYAGDTNFNISVSTGTSQTVNPKLVVTSTAFAILTGTCSSQVSVQTQNANGSAANQTPGITLNLSSNSGGGKFFSDPSCNTQVSSVAINSGASTGSFYYSDTIIGGPVITVASTGLTSVIQQETITGLRFGTGAFSVPVNTCSAAISLQSANSQSGGGPTSLTQATTINLISSPASGKFYSDAACTTQITSTTISPAIDAGHDSPNFFFENTSAGSSTLTGSAGTASAQQTESVVTPPSISKAFAAAMIPINGTTSLTFTITNPAANTVALTGVAFTDNLPAGLVVATPNGLSSTCGGTTTAAAGGGTVGLTNGTTAINGSCAISVNVTGTNSGVKNNSVTVGSTNGGAGNTSTASITVASPPTISKAFTASSITLGSSTSVTFTINNTNTIGLTGVAFTDNLPAGLVVATPNGLSSTCGGTTTSVASSSSASLSGGTVAASSSCSISLNVTGTALGVQNNTAGTITSTESGPGATSNTATLTITGTPPSITSSANTTFTAGAPGSFTVTTSGTPTPSLSDGGATLPGSVTFHDNGNGTATLAGTATAAGSYQFTITAQNGVTPNAGQLFTLTVAASTITHLALTPATTTIMAGGSQVYTAEGLDLYNNPAGDVTNATVFAIAPDGSCGTPNPGNNTCTATVADMNGSSHTVTGTYMNSATGSASLTVNAASPTQLVISSSAFAIIAGQCSANIAVTSQDQYGNASNVSSATQLNLSSASGTGKFYSDSSCRTPIPASNGKISVNMAANSSTQTFAYEDTTPSPLPDSTTTITAADDATILTSGSQAETILQLVFTTSSFTVTQNACSAQITLTAKNAKGTAANVTVAATLGLTSTSNGATFYSDNTCAMAITATGAPLASDVTLGSGASVVSFSYEDSAAGNPTITATIGGYSVAQQEQIVTPPSVTANPSGQAVTYGSNAMFTAAASGTPTPTVQWQVYTSGNWSNLSDGGFYSGATTTTLTLTAPPVSLSGTQYQAVFTNPAGTATSKAATLTVNQATSSVTVTCPAMAQTYTGSAQTPCTASYSTSDGLSGSPTVTYTNNVNAGMAGASASYAGDANHAGSSNTVNFTICKANSTTVVIGGSFTYDGNPHAATVSVTGAGGLSLTPTPTYTGSCIAAPPITVAQGTSCLASYTYTGDVNHTGSSSSAAVTITAATPGLPSTQTGTSTYGTSVTLTVKITATGSGETPTGSVQFQFSNGGVTYNICSDGSLQAQQPSPGTPCVVPLDNTGTATVTTTKLPAGMTADAIAATYIPGDSNYTGGMTSINYTVSMASTLATLKITPATAPTYGDTVTLSSTVSDSTTDSTGTPTGTVQFEYSTDRGSTWINIGDAVTLSVALDGTDNAQTTTMKLPAGTPQVKAVYSGDTNFTGSSSGATVYPVNQKALTVTGITASNRPYDGLTDATLNTASEALVGAVNSDSVTLSGTATAAFTPDGNVGNNRTVQISGLTLTGAAAANYTVTQPTTTANITPVQLTVTAPSPSVTYGDPVPILTPQIIGFVHGEDSGVLTTQPTCTTTYTPSSNAGSSPTTSCSGAVATNYTFTYTSGTVTVNQAPSTTVVTFEAAPYTYRGAAFTATAVVTGIGGLNQAVAVVYSGDCTNVTSANGCTATATFAGDTNHTTSMDHKSITINQAPSTTVETFEAAPYTYRGTAFTATAVVTGVGGLNQAVAVVYSGDCTNVTSANGCTATATFAGDTNHTTSMDHKSITINQAPSTTVETFEAAPYTYRGTAFTATAVVTGVGGLNQAVAVVYSGDCTNVTSANGCTATATFAGDTNHTTSMEHKSITINQAPSTTMVACPMSVTYSGSPQTPCTAAVTGAGLSITPAVMYSGDCTNVTAAGCTAAASYPGDTNHTPSLGSTAFTISPVATSTTVSSSPNPSNWGNVVTLTATVANTSTVAAPTGSLSFYNAASGATCSSLGTSALLDTVQLTAIGTSQQASTSTPNLPVGPGNTVSTDAILACYNYNPSDPNFNANFVASNGTTTQTVNPAPIATLVPSSLSFGGQQGGTTSGAQTVTICNGPSGISGSPCFNAPISTAALVISNIGFTSPNTNPVYFNQTSTCPIGGTGVPLGGSCTSNVKFAPPLNAQGIATALLTVTDNNENVASSTQSASLVGAGTSAVTGVGSLSTYAIFGTANGCSSVNVSGNGTVDSLGNSNSSGNVGTNGNVTLSGNPVVNGAVYSPLGGTGNCSTKTMTGLSTSGKAQATGGLQALSGPVNYPLPPAPNPAPPTTTQNISGSCGSISGCSNNGSKNVTLAAGQYGNLSISGGTIVNVSGGNYNINSLTLSGNSTLVVTPNTGAVVLNLAGKSLSGGNAVLDFSGGSMSNPSGMASNLQLYYAGSQPMKLSGGTGSYAVVYAPNAPVNVSGGSHFYGSIIGSTVNSSGNTAIHYPTSLPSISSGNSIWFSSNGLTLKGLPNTGSVKLYVTNASINFMANGTTYNLPVPNAVITFSSTATSASTTWDATNNRWSTLIPMSSVNGNATIHSFFDGVAFQVPAGGFPAGIQNVTWQAAYSTSTTGLSFNWQWGAAVYSTLPATGSTGNYGSFGVSSLDNSVPAGTPVNYEGNLIFGDTGAGYTGLYANLVGVVPTIAPMNIAPGSYDFGGVSQGSTATANLAFVLTNNDSVPYTIGSIQMTGTYAGDFVQTDNCPISPNTLGAGASCTFTVTFTPSTSGGTKETAKIVINDNANNSPQTVFLKGAGQ